MCAFGAGGILVGVAVKSTICQAEHGSVKAVDERLTNIPLAFYVFANITRQNGVRCALYKNCTLRLRVACMAGATTRTTEYRLVCSFIGNLKVIAINGDNS